MKEKIEWRKIEGYENYLEVSNDGRVRSVSRWIKQKNNRKAFYASRIIKNHTNYAGYVMAQTSIDGKVVNIRVSRAVAKAFIPQVPGKNQVDHIDGNKLNNCVSNLRWVSPKENVQYAIKNGLRKPFNKNFMSYTISGTKENKTAIEAAAKVHRKKIYCYSLDGKLLAEYKSNVEAAKENNVSMSGVSACCRGKLPKLKGKIYSHYPLYSGVAEA